MKKTVLFTIFMLSIVLISCDSEHKTIDNYEDDWKILVSVGGDNPRLSIIDMPEGIVINNDVYSENTGNQLPAPITDIHEYRDLVYLLMPEANRIEVFDSKSFDKIADIDFSDRGYEPADICFPNATDAYICHGNDSLISLLDITNFELAREIKVGKYPVSIACSGNQIFTANKEGHTVSIVDSRLHEEVAALSVFPYPIAVESTRSGEDIVVVSTGHKSDEYPKTPALASFLSVESRSITSYNHIGFTNIDPIIQVPAGLAVTKTDWAFIPTQEAFLRLDTRIRDRFFFVSRMIFKSVKFNPFRNELLLITEENGNCVLYTADQTAGQMIQQVALPENTLTVQPLE